MEVGRGEQFALTCLEPTFAGARLTFRAVPIAAAVIRDGGTMSTAGAFIDVAAESGGATACDGEQDLDMGPADPPAGGLGESGFCGGGPNRPLPRGPAPLFLPFVTAFLHHRGPPAVGG